MTPGSAFDKFQVKYMEGEMIFCEFEPGENFYLIQSGSVRVTKVINNQEKTLDVLKKGEFFGEMAILENAPRSASIIAREDCTLLEFNKSNFKTLMESQPQLAFSLLKILSKRIFDQRRRFMTLTLDDPLLKIYDVFIMLIEKQMVGVVANAVISAKPSEVAHWAGIDVKECERLLRDLDNKGKIELHPEDIIIKNPDALKRIVAQKREN